MVPKPRKQKELSLASIFHHFSSVDKLRSTISVLILPLNLHSNYSYPNIASKMRPEIPWIDFEPKFAHIILDKILTEDHSGPANVLPVPLADIKTSSLSWSLFATLDCNTS